MSLLDNENNGTAEGERAVYKKETRLTGVRSECGADFVLPDYMGDVKRLLRSWATVTPCNKFISGGELSFLSTVNFKIMYLDAENVLTEAAFSADLEDSERISDSTTDASIETRVVNVTVRLGGPRKISAKASLVTDISLSEECVLKSGVGFEGAVSKTCKVKVHSADYLKCAEREYAEEIDRLEDVLADEIEVVKYDASASVLSVHKTDSGVNVSGSILAWCIFRVGDDTMRLEKCIPLEENFEVDGDTADSSYIANCYITGVNINMNNTPEDKDGNTYLSVVMNMTAECEIEHHRNCELSLVCDAFREGAKNVCTYDTFSYTELIGTVCERRKISIVTERGDDNMHDILERDCTVKNLKCETACGEMTVTCDLAVSLVCRGSDTGECFTVKLDAPMRESIKLAGVCESIRIRLSVTPCEISPAFDSEKIYVDVTAAITAVCEESKSMEVLGALTSNPKEERASRRITAYYPEIGDTLWSVSKKYAVSPEKIASRNMLSADSDYDTDLSGKTKIIIS